MVDFVISRAQLGYEQVQAENPKWSHLMVNDYLGITQSNIQLIQAIQDNQLAIDALEVRVTQNETDIGALEIRVTAVELNLTNHIADTGAHGVTGTNVGTGDYCTLAQGGVVDLMALVANAVASAAEIILADVGAAPAAYSQAYADLQTALLNDVKDKHNTMLADLNNAITQFNDLVAKSKTAKQMSTV